MNKIYIIEGQDRCGKSTAVDILRKTITNPKILVIHSAKPPRDVDVKQWTLDYYWNLRITITQLYLRGYDIILDRSWLGETVYGPLYRNVTIPLKELELPATFPQALLVLVDDASSIASRSDGLSMSDNIDMLENERSLFKHAFNSSCVANKELVDWSYEVYSKQNLETLIKEMINAEC